MWVWIVIGVVVLFAALARGAADSTPSAPGRISFESAGPAEMVHLHGSYTGGLEGHQATATLSIVDISADLEEPLLLYCVTPSVFLFEEQLTHRRESFPLPHESAELNGVFVGVLPPSSALWFPKRGLRRIQIRAWLEQDGLGTLVEASVERSIESNVYGFLEQDQLSRDAICRLAELGVLVAASDGDIAKSEAVLIRSFLEERLGALEAGPKIKEAVNESFRRIKDEIRGGVDVLDRAGNICRDIRRFDPDSAEQTAFELALKVVAADGVIEGEEERILGVIRDHLELTESEAESMRDRHIQVTQLEADGDEQLAGIDPAWPTERKISFIKSAYRKWSARVTHSDPLTRTDAEARVEILGRLLAKYDG